MSSEPASEQFSPLTIPSEAVSRGVRDGPDGVDRRSGTGPRTALGGSIGSAQPAGPRLRGTDALNDSPA
eukprot:6207575-Pleurochrysis_carterae.AAC.3